MSQSRHRDWTFVENALAAGAPIRVPIAGSPHLYLDVVPADGVLVLTLPYAGSVLTAMENALTTRLVREADGTRMMQILNSSAAALQPFYAFCCEVADRVQIDGLNANDAIRNTLRQWRDLLATTTPDAPDIGMFGELLALRGIATNIGWPTAISAWKGPLKTEHDFGLPHLDVEVKTASGADRVHTIHGPKQLVPSAGRPLWLLSFHVTRGGAGGVTLPALARQIVAAADADGADTTVLETTLNSLLAEESDQAPRLVMRSQPIVLRVDERFPLVSQRVSGVAAPVVRSYALDLSSMSSDENMPPELSSDWETS